MFSTLLKRLWKHWIKWIQYLIISYFSFVNSLESQIQKPNGQHMAPTQACRPQRSLLIIGAQFCFSSPSLQKLHPARQPCVSLNTMSILQLAIVALLSSAITRQRLPALFCGFCLLFASPFGLLSSSATAAYKRSKVTLLHLWPIYISASKQASPVVSLPRSPQQRLGELAISIRQCKYVVFFPLPA